MDKHTTKAFDYALLHPKHWGMWLVVGLLWLLVRCLSYRQLMALGSGLSSVIKRVMPYRLLVAKTNITHCFKDSTKNPTTIYHNHICNLGKGIFEMAMGWFLPTQKFTSITHHRGIEHIESAHQENRGVLLLGLHTTNLDFGVPLLNSRFPTYFMYRKMKNPVLEYVVAKGRLRHCPGIIEQSNLRELLQRLNEGQCVWYGSDQDFGDRGPGVFAPFFGQAAYTLPLYAKIALKTNAAVIPAAGFRNDETGQYDLLFLPEIPREKLQSEYDAACAMNQAIETLIDGYEAQYYWVHRRFKTRPEGENPLYPPKPSHVRGNKKRKRS